MKHLRGSLGAALLALIAAACSSSLAEDAAAPPAAPTIPVTVDADNGSVTLQAEIADDVEERTRGLMYRTSLAPERGMLFLFPREEQRSFWMRNTLISLDMVFIRADRTVLGVVHQATPRTDTGRSVPGKSQFVLEIGGGLAKKHGIRAGGQVRFYAPVPSE